MCMAQMVIHVMKMGYAVVNLMSLMPNVIHVKTVFSTFLSVKVNNTIGLEFTRIEIMKLGTCNL